MYRRSRVLEPRRRLLTFKLFFPLRYRQAILLNPYFVDLGLDDVLAISLPV